MTTPPGDTLERTVQIAARPEIVFSYFTDPARMVRWMGMLCSIDPRPGGMLRVVINEHLIHRGEYVEVTPYSRIVYTWGFEDANAPIPPGGSTVEISLIPNEAGTTLHLRHSGLPVEHDGTDAGWAHYLARLAMVCEGGDPGRDRWTGSKKAN